ncbi:MAG: 16S rRNA (guanine(966)-N(2))-methyltransferase RsmD [Myxococcota bacterium]
MAGTLRITGGTMVRQRFNVPNEADENLVRPASDRVREAIYSSLGTHIIDAKVLDLFAGSGAYGFEAISRGAKTVFFTEKSRETAACVKANIAKLKLGSVCKLRECDALTFVKYNVVGEGIFDLVFVDPPYTLKLEASFWSDLKPCLHEDTLVVFRCKSKEDFTLPEGYEFVREKKYGGTWVAFLRRV